MNFNYFLNNLKGVSITRILVAGPQCLLEAKREQYRRFLEQSGVTDALTKALVKLYEESENVTDPIQFVSKHMCEKCKDDEEYEKLKEKYEKAKSTIANLEKELNNLKGISNPIENERITETLENLLSSCDELQNDINCKSLLKKYYSNELFKELYHLKSTKSSATLMDIIKSGLTHHDSVVGVYAADSESYITFEKLLRPIVLDYHKKGKDKKNILQKRSNWGEVSTIENLDPEKKYILSIRIHLSRNIIDKSFLPVLDKDGFQEIENICKTSFLNLKNELSGTYESFTEIDSSKYEEMIQRNIIFRNDNKYLDAAGMYRFWPVGRGIFRNNDETLLVWVNEEDHMKIISMSNSGNLGDVYQKLVEGIQSIQKSIDFVYNDNYGYLTTCPTNLGTTMHASVYIKLPNLLKNKSKLNEICEMKELQIHEHNGILEVSNKEKLGPNEFEIIKNFEEGIQSLIEAEEKVI